MIVIAVDGCTLSIPMGRRGENNARQISFDLSVFTDYYGAGTAQLLHQRKGDATPYIPAQVEQSGDKLLWTLTSDDTAMPGTGRAELRWYVGDALAKSVTFSTSTARSMGDPGGEPEEVRSALDLLTEQVEGMNQRVPSGGTKGQVLAKASGADYDTEWTTVEGGGGDYTASAETLPAGSPATVTLTDGAFRFGIPKGDTGATGPQGERGSPGAPGAKGEDGFSPTISITDITGGHRVTITDETGAHSFDVMDGEDAPDAVTDVQVNGTSIVTDGVANVPVGSNVAYGVVKIDHTKGITASSGTLLITHADGGFVKDGTSVWYPIVPSTQHASAFYGLAKAAGSDERNSTLPVGQYTESAKSAISEMFNGSVTVTGTTPTINALPGVRYVCGTVNTISITPPASGIIDVVFTSGTTAAVLTVPSTVTWANGFDPAQLDTDTTYEINIMDGLGVAASWT